MQQTILPGDEKAVVREFDEGDCQRLLELFEEIARDPEARHFHPHPFDELNSRRVAGHDGEDIYLGLFIGEALLGYGMLRGWDEGYPVPSLGIYLSGRLRGLGYSRYFMGELHRFARERGASAIRLKVYPDNEIAAQLYRGLGYQFRSTDGEQWLGILDLENDHSGPD